MARIRSIKPEFPQSETIGSLSRDARLLFIQLWTIADDAGRARAASRMLASLLFPYDDDAPGLIDGWMAELEKACCVVFYVVDGSRYLQISNWQKHQKIDRPSDSKLPAFVDPSRGLARPRVGHATDLDLGGDQDLDLDLDQDHSLALRADSEKSQNQIDQENEDRFFAVYPKRIEHDAVRRKLASILKARDASLEQIIAGCKRYRSEVAGKEARFVKSPLAWLEAGRWKDGLGPSPPPSEPPTQVFIRRDNPLWDHYRDRYIAEHGMEPKVVNGGKLFPIEWVAKSDVAA